MSDSNLSPESWPGLDEVVERFEDAWQAAVGPSLSDHLPATDHPEFEAIAIELLCVDYERRVKSGVTKSIEAYRQEFPQLFQHQAILEGVAFEAYRLQAGEDTGVVPATFARKYGVRTEHWPAAQTIQNQNQAIAHSALVQGVSDEMHRIASVSEIPEVGDCFFDFELQAELGACQFGRVYLARQRGMSDREVVIKISSNVWLECERLARLQHTHIVPVYSVHEQGGLQAVCMPFLGRKTLQGVLAGYFGQDGTSSKSLLEIWATEELSTTGVDQSRQRRRAELEGLTHEQLCAWIILKVADGLSHAHERGILHRDLKPANILMTDDLRPMILDFNLSDDAVAGGRPSLLIGGTLPYMSPEHLMAVVSEGTVDERSDVYSLGVILFQLLTGKLPFEVPPNSTMGRIHYLLHERSKTTPSVRTHSGKLSVDMESIVSQCLAADPTDRYRSAQELCEDLERHLRAYPPRHAPVRSRRERWTKWAKRHPRLSSFTSVGTIAALLVFVCSWFYLQQRTETLRLAARESFESFKQLEITASAPLSIPRADESLVASGIQRANSALSLVGAHRQDWFELSPCSRLSLSEQQALRALVQRIHYLLAQKHLRRAMEAPEQSQQLLERAYEHYQLAKNASVYDESAALRVLYAEIQYALGHECEPYRLPEDLADADGVDKSSRCLMAIEYLARRRFDDAEQVLIQLNRESPKDFFVWLMLGHCKMGRKKWLQADSCLSAAIALWPESADAYYLRGRCRRQASLLPEAAEDFTRSLKLLPDHSGARRFRATTYLAQNRHLEAISDLTKLIDAGHGKREVYLLRAKARAALGQVKLAEADRHHAIEIPPVSADDWIQRGLLLRKTDLAESLACFDHALKIEPESQQAIQNRVAVLSQLNRDEEAAAAMAKLLTWEPNNKTYLLGRGLLLARGKKRAAALEDYARALPQIAEPIDHYQAARLFACMAEEHPEDLLEAAHHLRTTLARRPQFVLHLSRDPDLQRVAEEPEVREVIAAARTLVQSESSLTGPRK